MAALQLGAVASGQPALSVQGGRQSPEAGSQTGRAAGQAVAGQIPWHRPEVGLQTGQLASGQSVAVAQGASQTPLPESQLGAAIRVQSVLVAHAP